MRSSTRLTVAVVTLVVSATAWATPITWVNPPPQGRTLIRFDVIDWSMGKTYSALPPVLPVEGVAALNALPQNASPGAQVITFGQTGPGGIGASLVGQTEDFWGVVKVLSLVADPRATQYWTDGRDPNCEIVGLVYGGVDTYVSTTALGNQVVSGAGLFLDLYAQPKGTFDYRLGSSGRIAFDKYTGVGYDAAGAPIPGTTLLFHMESTDSNTKAAADATPASDIDGDGDVDGDFLSVFTPAASPPGSGTGKSSLFWDIVGGAWQGPPGTLANPSFEAMPNYFGAFDPRFGASVDADLHADQNINPYPTTNLGPMENWTISSEDPTRGGLYVPEPATLGLLAAGGLALIRRRGRR